MGTPTVRWSRDAAQAEWIGSRLEGFGSGMAGSVVPHGFAAYARLLHPAVGEGGERIVRWRDVAEWSGLAFDRQAQFVDIAMPEHLPRTPAPWEDPPAEGTLHAHDATALVELLARHTAEQQCWFCVWEGYGDFDGAMPRIAGYLPENAERRTDADAVPGVKPRPPHEAEPRPDYPNSRVHLPGRDYFIYTGPLRAALTFLDSSEQTPNLFWPQDRSWCVATEIDLDSTFLAGPDALIEDALADPALEALPATTSDSILRHTPDWVTRVVRPAVAELLEHGRTSVTVDYGTVRAELDPPRRMNPEWLRTSSEGFGTSRSRGTAVSPTMRREVIESKLAEAILTFVAG